MKYAAWVLLSAVFGWLISLAIPNEYAAQAKIADEYKTTDLLIGLNTMNVMMRDLNPNSCNEGTDNIDIYSKVLQSKDFIKGVGQFAIRKYKQSYFDYLSTHHRRPFWEQLFSPSATSPQEQEAAIYEIIQDNIKYYLSSKSQTLEIQITDQDAEVAADVLDQTLSFLKKEIERLRSHRATAEKENALKNRKEACIAYQQAKSEYEQFADSHTDASSDYTVSRLAHLKKDYELKYDIYRKTSEEYVRANYLTKKENTSFVIVKKYNLSQEKVSPYRWAYAAVAFLIALFICLCHAVYTRKRQDNAFRHFDFGGLFSPWAITISIWTAILGFYYLLDTNLYPITSQFFYCFIKFIFSYLI